MTAHPAPFVPGLETQRQFRDALGAYATGVTIVTTMTEQGVVGITANSFASLSLDPPLVLWSPARSSSRFGIFQAAERFAIHVLSAENAELCKHFTKNAQLPVALDDPMDLAARVPGALSVFDCTREAAHDGGDHVIIVGRVQSVLTNAGAPLVFHAGRFGAFSAG